MKISFGPIANPNTGVKMDIVCEHTTGMLVKDLLVGGAFMVIGAMYIAKKSFIRGAKSYDSAEVNVLEKLGLILDEQKES